jgi:hypothetical protein
VKRAVWPGLTADVGLVDGGLQFHVLKVGRDDEKHRRLQEEATVWPGSTERVSTTPSIGA